MMNQQEFDKSVNEYVRAEGIDPTPRPQSTWYTQATWQSMPQSIQRLQERFAQHNQALQQAYAQAAIQQALVPEPESYMARLRRTWGW